MDNTTNSRGPPRRAPQACTTCKKAKRRCDKVLPTCTLCNRLRKSCDYSANLPSLPTADDFTLLRDKVTELEAKLDRSLKDSTGTLTPDSASPDNLLNLQAQNTIAPSPNFPAAFFLDAEVYGKEPVPRPLLTIPQQIWTLLDTNTAIQAVIERHFQTIHTWLPIVSKKRLSLNLANPNLEPTADLALLLLAMKSIATRPTSASESRSVRNDLYWRLKGFASVLETSGLLSVQLLQSYVFLSAYEIGHGVYPAAYLTTGHAARLGHALGVHERKTAPQMLRRAGAWAETEETARTWWAVMLMDRYVNLGSFSHPLATDDPSRTSLLPADDGCWDIGEMTSNEPLYVSSKTSLPASWFQRTCQATHVVGRYIRHRDDKLLEPRDRFIEAGQLLRTINALAALLPNEVEERPEQFGTPIALCYTTLIHLCDPYACAGEVSGERTAEEFELQTVAIAGLKQAAADVYLLSHQLQTVISRDLDASSPLTIEALYQAAATYAWLVHETGELANIKAYSQITGVLEAMETRWACVTEYLKLLETSKQELYAENANLASYMRR